MLRKLLFTGLLFFIANFIFAQDTIYLNSREKIIAKVQEINPTQVKYKLFSSPDGPVYIVNKEQIWKIVYSDGHSEFFRDEDDTEEIKDIRPILIGVNSFELMFGFVTLNAEYYFPEQGIGIKMPVSIGLRGIKGDAGNYPYNYDEGFYYYNRMKVVSIGTQLLFYPGKMKHRVNYFTGLAFEYGRMFTNHYTYNYPNYYAFSKATHDWFGTGIVNGIMINLSDRVSLGMSAIVGLEVIYKSYQQNSVGITTTHYEAMGRMDFTLGFRFGKIHPDEKSSR